MWQQSLIKGWQQVWDGGTIPGSMAGSCPQLSGFSGGAGMPDWPLHSQGSSKADREGSVLPERHLQEVQCWQHPEAPSQEPNTEGSAVSEDSR